MARRRIVAVGDNTIDRFRDIAVPDLVGGNALNVAVQALRSGGDARYFGAVGSDLDGQVVRAAVEAAGLASDGLRVDAGHTALTVIGRDSAGERRFESEDFGVTAGYFPLSDELDRIAASDWVHIGMLGDPIRLVEELRRRDRGLPISQDLAVSPDVGALDVAFVSGGADLVADRRRASELVGRGVPLAVVTRGAAGALAFDGATWWSQDAVATTVVDTTGAGDSFIAGFIDARLRGRDVAESMSEGARLAAATCRHLGGWPQTAG